jgi:hypothetical protein
MSNGRGRRKIREDTVRCRGDSWAEEIDIYRRFWSNLILLEGEENVILQDEV